MRTRQLWRALNHPPATHPIFRREVVLPGTAKRRYVSWAGLTITLVIGLSEYSPVILMLLLPLMLFVTGVLYGIECALRVSHVIALEQENGTYALLSLSPPGQLGTSWVVGLTSLYRNREFDQLHSIFKNGMAVTLIMLTLFSILALLFSYPALNRRQDGVATIMPVYVTLMVIFCASYIDYIQSVILGCLVGLLVPTFYENVLNSAVYALGGFLLAQVGTLLLAALVGIIVLPGVYDLLGFYGEIANWSQIILSVVTLVGAREVVIRVLWSLLAERCNAATSEQSFILRG